MMSPLPPLVALRAFHALGVIGSIRLAGDALGVSHTVVSRHVRNLEAALGVKLVTPAGRGLMLTQEGARFHAAIHDPLRQIAEAAAALSRGRQLTLRCVPGLANARVVPHLAHLRRALPHREVTLEPVLSRRVLDKAEVDVEIVYRLQDDIQPPLRGASLGRPRIFPVLSPELAAHYGRPANAAEILALPLVHDHSRDLWERWLHAMATRGTPAGAILGTQHLAIEAARQGQGVAIANEMLVAEDLAAGRLIEPVPSDVRPYGYFLIAEISRWDDPDIAVVRAWCQRIMASVPRTGAKKGPIRTK